MKTIAFVIVAFGLGYASGAWVITHKADTSAEEIE